MKRLIKIYALFNPIDKNIFYIGATSSDLNVRLAAHCVPYYYADNKRSFGKKKSDYIFQLKEYNTKPEIMLLEEVNHDDVDKVEEFYYYLFKSYGFTLIQDKNQFKYTKRGSVYKNIYP